MTAPTLRLPFLRSLAPHGLPGGSVYLVNFHPHSLWFEATFTLVAQAIAAGVPADYHVFQRPPADVEVALTRLGTNPSTARRKGLFRLLDSYTVQTGRDRAPGEAPYQFVSQSLRMKDWKAPALAVLADENERDRLHIDDNNSLLANANSENEILDFFQSRALDGARENGLTFFHGFLAGVHSRRFYRQMESLVDGIFDFASWEAHDTIVNGLRLRMLRGRSVDTRWRVLGISPRGAVHARGIAPASRSTPEPEARSPGPRADPDPPVLARLRSPNAWPVLHTLTEAFLEDLRSGRDRQEEAGWRSLVQVAQAARISRSTLYPRDGLSSPAIRELEAAGLLETRLTAGSRGRGGVAMKLRVAAESEFLRSRLRQQDQLG